MSNLDANLGGNPISPKVTLPVVLQLIALAATTAGSLSWDKTQWVQSALIVITALSGYFVNDPNRSV